MIGTLQNLRLAARLLLRAPTFTLVAVGTLALGIGATVTVFTVVNALLLRPLPVESPEQLLRLHAALRNAEDGTVRHTVWSYPDVEAYAALDDVFSGVAARHHWSATYGADPAVRLSGHAVTGNFFELLGMRASLGRTILPADDLPEDPARVVVLSEAAWRTHFGADPAVVGRTVSLSGHPFTVVGVMADDPVFRATGEPELWVPVRTRASLEPWNSIETRNVAFIPHVVGRLRPGVDEARARAAVETMTARLASAYPENNAQRLVVVTPAGTLRGYALPAERAKAFGRASVLLMAVVGIVLLIACANVANLMLVRTAARRHELGVRAALGAGRRHLGAQFLAESVLLAAAGAGAGLWLATLGLSLARRIPEVAELSPAMDGRVLAFTVAAALVTALAFGTVPALAAARWMGSVLRATRTATRRLRVQRALVVGQIGLALLLVVASGLVLRTLRNLTTTDLGFQPERLLVAPVSVQPAGEGPEALSAAVRALVDEVRSLPGVAEASASSVAPLARARMTYTIEVEGYTPAAGENVQADLTTVLDDYFRTLGTPLVAGEGFEALPPADTRAVMVNQAMAERFWPAGDAVGGRFVVSGDTVRVAGVVGNVRHVAVGEEPEPMFFLRHPRLAGGFFYLHVRAQGDPAALAGPVREVVRAATPGVPVPTVQPMAELVRDSLAEARIVAAFFSLLGSLALVLAAVGLYGVLAYAVALRTREIGIRVALGARSGRVTRAVLRDSGLLVLAGVALGLPAGFAATRLLRGVLYGVTPGDAPTFAAAAAALVAVGLLAAYLPARRAARVDPMVALRAE